MIFDSKNYSLTVGKLKITKKEHTQRKFYVNEALAIVRLEGQNPGPNALAVFDEYVAGNITYDELSALIFKAALTDVKELHISLNKQYPTD